MDNDTRDTKDDVADVRERLAPLAKLDVDDVTSARIQAAATALYREPPAGIKAALSRRWRAAEPLLAFGVAAIYMILALRVVIDHYSQTAM